MLGNRSFQSAKTEVRPFITHARQRKLYGIGVPFACQPLDNWTAGIAEAQQFRHLVERLASGIVARSAHNLVLTRLRNIKEICVAAETISASAGYSTGGFSKQTE